MVGSRSLDRLQRYADVAGAKVVLVGDNRQLSSIDAGGALRTLSRELGTQVVELTTNRRQAGVDQAWEREALDRLRNGDIAPAVAAYVEHGRLTLAEDVEMARAQLIEAWWAVHEQSTAILAVARSDVAALNDLARQRRNAAGELGEELRLASGKAFSVGDRVLFEKNQRLIALGEAVGTEESTLHIRNGTFGTVVILAPSIPASLTREGDVTRAGGDGRDHDAVLVVDLDAGGRVALPEHYVEESTSLGYALTVFRAQGITVNHAFVLGNEGLFQEAAYTAMSRGRLTNHLYATTADDLRSEIGHEARDERRDAMASLVASLSTTREQTMALDHFPDRHPAGAALSTPRNDRDRLPASAEIHAQGPEIARDSPSIAAELSSLGDKLDALQKSLEDLEDTLDRFEPRTSVRSAPAWDYDSYDRDVGLDDGLGL
jgi:ATP-dependent exoDNAse (exonuclease V) alpha subunit